MYPFTNAANPNWLYLTPSLKGTLEMMREMIADRQGLGFILGDNGMGKTSVLRFLHAEYSSQEERYTTALISLKNYPSPFAFLRKICGDFGIEPKRSLDAQHEAFEPFLLQQYQAKRRVVVFIDEGQLMKDLTLEVLRGLLNFETPYGKLVQLVVAAQVDIRDRLVSRRNKAIRSRIFAPCLIKRFTADETAGMIAFRCQQAGVENPFDRLCLAKVHELAHGVPREIILICAHAYRDARKDGSDRVLLRHVEGAGVTASLPELEPEAVA